MAGSLQPRIKTWVAGEDVTAVDLNAEFDNTLEAMQPSLIDDFSASTTQMRQQTDPGEVGSENPATTLGGEIERLRYELTQIKGGVSYWYEAAPTSLSDLRNLIGGNASANRISSGQKSTRSNQLTAVVPDGSNDGLKIDATPTPFVYFIDNVQYTLSADATIDGLVKAPSTNNTCLVDDGTAADGQETKYLGEFESVINVDNMGSEISSLVGKVAGFRISDGSNTECFIAHVESSTRLRNARRGFFYDSSVNPIPRIAFANNDTITLMKITWIFLTTAGAIQPAYNEPVYASSAPSSPSIGDYWYDLANETWKRFDGAMWASAGATLVGMSLQDSTNCVAARTMDQFIAQSDINTIDLERISNSTVRVKNYGAQVTVFGSNIRFGHYRPTWSMDTNLDTGVTEAANTTYFLYVKEDGSTVISNVCAQDRRGDLFGFYHPTETWRCVGLINNDGSSNLTAASLVAHSRTKGQSFWSNDTQTVGTTKMFFGTAAEPGWLLMKGDSISRFHYNALYETSQIAVGNASGTADAYHFNLADQTGFFFRGLDTGTSGDPDSASRVAQNTGGNTGATVGTVQGAQFAAHDHDMLMYEGTGSGTPGVSTGHIASQDSGGAGILRAAPPNATNTSMIVSAGGNETRPRNVAANFAIKVLP